MEVSRNITVIPARKRVGNTAAVEQRPKLKVSAYRRYPPDSGEQASSGPPHVGPSTHSLQMIVLWHPALV